MKKEIVNLLEQINKEYNKKWTIQTFETSDLVTLKMDNGDIAATEQAILFLLEEEKNRMDQEEKNKKGLDFYIQEMKNQEKNYKYYELMTMMEHEFSNKDQEAQKVYQEIKKLRDENYNI